MGAFHQLLSNGAFWGFLGTCVAAWLTYKGAVFPALEQRRRNRLTDGNGKVNPQKATSFDELKAVVGILQGELDRKDKAHTAELLRAYERITSLEGENTHLYQEIEKLKERLHKAHINYE